MHYRVLSCALGDLYALSETIMRSWGSRALLGTLHGGLDSYVLTETSLCSWRRFFSLWATLARSLIWNSCALGKSNELSGTLMSSSKTLERSLELLCALLDSIIILRTRYRALLGANALLGTFMHFSGVVCALMGSSALFEPCASFLTLGKFIHSWGHFFAHLDFYVVLGTLRC